MDPTIELCQIRDTFTTTEPTPKIPAPFKIGTVPSLQPLIKTDNDQEVPNLQADPLLVDTKLYEALEQVKAKYNHPKFNEARLATNPFEQIGNSIFMNRAAVKMANLDMVFDMHNSNCFWKSRSFQKLVGRHCPETVDAAPIGADVKGSVSDGQPKRLSVDRSAPQRLAGGGVQGLHFTVAAGEDVVTRLYQGKRTSQIGTPDLGFVGPGHGDDLGIRVVVDDGLVGDQTVGP